MSYWYSERSGVQSYVAGVNYGALMQEALNPENRTAENERLATTAEQDDYFKKQQLVKEAMAQLQSNGYVEPKIAKEIDIESLKESLEKAENGETSLVDEGSLESSIGSKAQSEETLKSGTDIETKAQTPLQATQNTQTSQASVLTKKVIQTSADTPKVSEEVKGIYNPLVFSSEDSAQKENVGNVVEFTDDVNGEKVRVPLNEQNAERLIQQFGSLEEASDYVKGFYYDAAYTLGYLSGDADGNGKISLEEGVNLKSLVSLKDGEHRSIAESMGGDLEAQKKFLEQIGYIDNIGDFINHSLNQDSDFDGALSLNEMLGDDGKAVLFKVSENSNDIEMFVIWKFNFNLTQESLEDTLLNLGAKDEKSTKVVDSKEAKEYLDDNYLESLDENKRENVLKGDKILANMMKSA